MSTTLQHVYRVYIRTTPERLWQAITDGDLTKLYFFGGAVQSDWRAGSVMRYASEDGQSLLEGEIFEVDPPRKLVHSFIHHWEGESKDPPSRVTYEIEPHGETCLLTLTHEHFAGETELAKSTQRGWSLILSSMKSLLETGQPLALTDAVAATA